MAGDDGDPVSAASTRLRPVKAAAIALDSAAGVAGVFSVLILNCSVHMLANEDGLLQRRNPEYLHQFRVGLRRLRSLFRVFRPVIEPDRYAALTAEMHWLAGVLGAARDWDVFLEDMLAPLVRCEPATAELAALVRRCRSQRRRCALAARAALTSPRYEAFKRELERFQTSPALAQDDEARQLLILPAGVFAAGRIARREKSVQRLAEQLDQADAARRHQLRIATKKLRYSVEFFRSLFDQKAARRYASALAEMQDALGRLNDCATARRLLAALPAGRNASADAGARILVLDWIALQEEHGTLALEVGCRNWRLQTAFW